MRLHFFLLSGKSGFSSFILLGASLLARGIHEAPYRRRRLRLKIEARDSTPNSGALR